MAAAVLEAGAQEQQLVAFYLGEMYGVDISHIHEIIRMQDSTPLPRSAPDIEGVINLRGKIVPVLDLRKRLGLTSAERTRATRIIVVELEDYVVGMIVDSVVGVLRINEDTIETPSHLVADVNTDFVRGVGRVNEELLILLNLDRVLQLEK